jgi:hypothetical protein
MLDTSALDYIYDNDLSAEVSYYIHNGYVSLFITHIQIVEVLGNRAISQDAIIRKCGIVQTILSIDVKIIPFSIAYISQAATSDSKRFPGYIGPQVGTFRAAGQNLVDLMAKYHKTKKTNPNITNPVEKNTADLQTLLTAIEEDMDFIVTNDQDMIKTLERIKKEDRPTKLAVINKENFIDYLNSLDKLPTVSKT